MWSAQLNWKVHVLEKNCGKFKLRLFSPKWVWILLGGSRSKSRAARGIFSSPIMELWRSLIQELREMLWLQLLFLGDCKKRRSFLGVPLWNGANLMQVCMLFSSCCGENGKDYEEMGTKPCCDLFAIYMCWLNERIKERTTE